jgi:4'-phosphopantetheinyl transferase
MSDTGDVRFSPPPCPFPFLLSSFSEDVVHIWRVSLGLSPHEVRRLRGILSADELIRADRFRFREHRARFVVARGMLRVILGRYLNQSPERLQFRYGPYGKPALESLEAFDEGRVVDNLPLPSSHIDLGAMLHFNVSHSQDMALYALAWDRPVGIDLEYVADTSHPLERLVARFFSPSEREAFQKLPAAQKPQAFFRCWTRKEAYMKARGQGFTLPLQAFDVSVAPDEPARLLNDSHDPQAVAAWTLRDLDPGHGYVAAVAARGSDWRLACWQWPGATFDRE